MNEYFPLFGFGAISVVASGALAGSASTTQVLPSKLPENGRSALNLSEAFSGGSSIQETVPVFGSAIWRNFSLNKLSELSSVLGEIFVALDAFKLLQLITAA